MSKPAKSSKSMQPLPPLPMAGGSGSIPSLDYPRTGYPEAGRKKTLSVRVLMAIMTMLAPVSAMAGPMGEQYKGGTSLVSRPDSVTTLIQQQSQKAVIEWDSFSIGSSEKVKVEQPGTDSILLNRVVGTTASDIFGSLTATGQVFVVNPNGVFFRPGSQVNVHGLMATTLDIAPAPFMAVSDGNYTFTATTDSHVKSVSNQGTIKAAQGGYIVLASDTVDNSEVIEAQLGHVALASGGQMTLDLAGDQLISLVVDMASVAPEAGVKNSATGKLLADGGQVLMTAKTADTLIGTVVNNQGQIRALSMQEKDGEILLLGDMDHGTTEVAGVIDASILATGVNGGHIVTAGHRVIVADNTQVMAAAAENGARGEWRIKDGVDFFIGAEGAPLLDGGGMSGLTLGEALATTDVVIERTGPPATGGTMATAQKTMASAITAATTSADLGDIVVASEVSWTSDSTLTLQANNNVVVNAPIKNTGNGKMLLMADLDGDNGGSVEFNLGSISGSLLIGGQASIFYNPSNYSDFELKKGYFDTYVASGSTGLLNTFMLVNDIDHLQLISTNLGASYALGQDIDATVTQDWNMGAGFVPLGSDTGAFMGTFAGNGHTITHLTINTPEAIGPTGLFGLASGSDIRDVGLLDANITGNAEVGALVGRNYGTVSNAYSTGSVAGADAYVGGLIGYNEGDVSNAYSMSSVEGHYYSVGGLIGANYLGTITASYSSGDVHGWDYDAGGLIGYNEGAIIDSFSTSNVHGDTASVGGLVGYNQGSIKGSFSSGAITGAGDAVGGLIGYNDSTGDVDNSGVVINAHSSSKVTGGEYHVGGLIGENYGAVSQSDSTGDVVGYGGSIGGLIGYNEGDVADSHSASSVTGDSAYVDAGTLEGSYYSVGGLIGENYGALNGTYSTGNVSGYQFKVGGLLGYNEGAVTNSHSTSNVSGGADYVGGLIGKNYSGTVHESYSTGAVNGTGGEVGGLIGSNEGGDITASHSSSAVTGTDYVGGLVGKNYIYNDLGIVSGSYSSGTVTGNDYVGGLMGSHESGLLETDAIATITDSHSSSDVSGNQYVGGLIGHNTNGPIMKSYSTGTVTGNHSVGGLIGYNSHGKISSTYNSGSVFGSEQSVGGLVGYNDYGTIVSSYNAGKVSAGANAVDAFGGLVGFNDGIVLNSYSTGAVTGTQSVGGLVGNNYTGTITASYSTGAVSGTQYVGGLVGHDDLGGESVINSFWDQETSGQSVSAGGQGLTTAQMKQQSSYPGWDFATTWHIYEGETYPLLKGFLTPLAVTIMADDASRIYGDPNPEFTYSISDQFDATQLQGWETFQLITDADLNSPVGNYAIVPSGQLSSTLYDIIYTNGVLTVTPRPLTLTSPLTVADKIYDGNTIASVTSFGTPGGVVGDDVVAVTGAKAIFATKDVGQDKQVTITDFVLGGADAANYVIDPQALLTSLAEITVRPLTVTITGNPTKPYDGTKVAHLTSANYAPDGFVANEFATISQTKGEYDGPAVGSHTVTSTLAEADFLPTAGTSLANYQLPAQATGPGTITAKTVPAQPPGDDPAVVIQKQAKAEVTDVTTEIIASTSAKEFAKESMTADGGVQGQGSESGNGEGEGASSGEKDDKEKKVGLGDSDQKNELQKQPLLSLDGGAVAGKNMVCK